MLETVNYKKLKKKIISQNINFLAFPVTPWAAHGVDAFICMMKQKDISLNGYICIIKHGQAGYLVDDSHFSFENENIKIILLDGNIEETFYEKIKRKTRLWRFLGKRRTDGKYIYILNQGCPNYEWHSFIKEYKPKNQVKSIIIDEGIGMYMRTKKGWLLENLSNTKGIKNKIAAFLMVEIKQPIMKKIIKTRNEIVDFCLFNKTKNEFVKNTNAVSYYKQVIYKNGCLIATEQKKLYEHAVVVNTQPFYEYGQVKENEDVRWLNVICKICEEYKVPVVLKPHPREKNLERYKTISNCIIDYHKGITQETIISQIKDKPICIIGFSSTTLITERLFEEIAVISLIDCVNERNFDKVICNDFKGFKKTFSNYVCFPQNENDLIISLKREIQRLKNR